MWWISKDHVSVDFVVPSTSKDNYYVVSWGINQYYDSVRKSISHHSYEYDWSCTCKDFRFRRVASGGYCKHILSVAADRILWAAECEGETEEESADAMGLVTRDGRYFTTSVCRNGKPVEVIRVSNSEYTRLKSSNNLKTRGTINAKQFALLISYILGDGRKYDLGKCVAEGRFYPSADYVLEDEIDLNDRCPECGTGRAMITYKNQYQRIVEVSCCLNSSCSMSINNVKSIECRRDAVAQIQ